MDELKIYDKIMDEINQQLTAQGIKIKNAECAITDATIIASAARPHNNNEWKGKSALIYDSEDANAAENTKGQFDNRVVDYHAPIKQGNARQGDDGVGLPRAKLIILG